MPVARMIKIALVSTVGVFGLLTGSDNIVDYPTNLTVVRHVLSMDMLPRSSPLHGRAITNAALQRAAYDLIIGVELLFGVLCLLGAVQLAWPGSKSAKTKDIALAGLGLGLILYVFGFLVVGGEWFQMWQAGEWNMQQAAFRFAGVIGIILLFVALPDEA